MDAGDNPFITNRSSTRVKYAPGGDSSLSFGNYEREKDNNTGRGNNADGQKNVQKENQIKVDKESRNEQSKDGLKAAGNLTTGRTTAQNDKRTNVKVNQPPGGASSIMFG